MVFIVKSGLKMVKNILFVITSHNCVEHTDKITGFHLGELARPLKFFQAHRYHCEIASVKGSKATPETSSIDINDPDIKEFWENPDCREMIHSSRAVGEFSPEQFDGVYFVGGYGCMWDFPYDPSINLFASELYRKGGLIGAVCHGPIALANITGSDGKSIIIGKNVTGFVAGSG
jgi:putative intracellular protease/amidase